MIDQTVVEPLRLSEAIRLGALLGPQAFDVMFDGEAICALGGAMLAFGLGLADEWPPRAADVANICVHCPECPRWFRVGMVIGQLNDEHRWSRDDIGSFVELHEAPPQPENPFALLWALANESEPVARIESLDGGVPLLLAPPLPWRDSPGGPR